MVKDLGTVEVSMEMEVIPVTVVMGEVAVAEMASRKFLAVKTVLAELVFMSSGDLFGSDGLAGSLDSSDGIRDVQDG